MEKYEIERFRSELSEEEEARGTELVHVLNKVNMHL